MSDIKLSEYLENNNIIEAIKSVENHAFLSDDSTDLNNRLSLLYGERIVFNKMVDYPLDNLAIIINSTFNDVWNSLIELSNLNLSIGGNGQETKTTNTTTTNTGNNSTEIVNKVSAFNDDSMVNNDGSNTSELTESERDIIATETKDVISLEQAYKNLSLVNKTNILNSALRDIANALTLNIY